MASTRKQKTKDGKVFYEIRSRVSREASEFTTRWYVPDGWSEKLIQRELAKQAAEFDRRCRAGEVKTKAQAKADKAEEERRAAAVQTVKQYCEKVFMPAKNVTISENTRSTFQSMLNFRIYPAIGDLKMPDVTSADISALLLAYQAEGKAHATVLKLYSVLRLIFKMAYLSNAIDRNPMDKVERPKQRKDEEKKTEVEAFSLDELHYILECLEKEPLKWRCFVRLVTETGARRGEACAVEWASVDFTNKTITFRQTLNYTKAKGVYIDTTKNKRTRTVDVSDLLISELRQLRQEQSESALSKYVFAQDGSAEPMFPQSPTRYFKKFGDKYGVDHFHPHKLRHSFASIAIKSGADIASVSEILGHSDKAVTLRVYAHSDAEARKRVSSAFIDALNTTEGPTEGTTKEA